MRQRSEEWTMQAQMLPPANAGQWAQKRPLCYSISFVFETFHNERVENAFKKRTMLGEMCKRNSILKVFSTGIRLVTQKKNQVTARPGEAISSHLHILRKHTHVVHILIIHSGADIVPWHIIGGKSQKFKFIFLHICFSTMKTRPFP